MVRKAYSPNTHDYKNTKMTEILTMTLTPQLRKKAIKKRASHPSSIREPNINFRKLVDKIEQAEISMKLEETENLKLQYVNSIHTTISQINKVHDSDTELAEKITQNLNIYEKNPNFKGKQSFKKWCNCCRRYGKRIAECRQKQQDNQNKPQKRREPIKSFYQYMKIYQIKKTFTVTKFQENRSLITIIPLDNHHFNEITIAEDLQKKNSRNFSQNRFSRSNSENNQYRNNYSRSNSNRSNYSNYKGVVLTPTPETDSIQKTFLKIPQTTETETTQTIGIEKYPNS